MVMSDNMELSSWEVILVSKSTFENENKKICAQKTPMEDKVKNHDKE